MISLIRETYAELGITRSPNKGFGFIESDEEPQVAAAPPEARPTTDRPERHLGSLASNIEPITNQ